MQGLVDERHATFPQRSSRRGIAHQLSLDYTIPSFGVTRPLQALIETVRGRGRFHGRSEGMRAGIAEPMYARGEARDATPGTMAAGTCRSPDRGVALRRDTAADAHRVRPARVRPLLQP